MSNELSARASRARLSAIGEELRALRGEGARVLYRLGLLLREVQDDELWRPAGYASFSAWLEQDADVARTTAARAIAIVRHFNEEIAVRYGFDKLYLGLRYMQLTSRVEQPGDLIALDLRVRGDNGRFRSVPFHEATVAEIQEAIAGLDTGGGPRLEDGLDARLKRLETAMPAAIGRAGGARVSASRARDGRVALTFRQVPLDELESFIAALRAELLDG